MDTDTQRSGGVQSAEAPARIVRDRTATLRTRALRRRRSTAESRVDACGSPSGHDGAFGPGLCSESDEARSRSREGPAVGPTPQTGAQRERLSPLDPPRRTRRCTRCSLLDGAGVGGRDGWGDMRDREAGRKPATSEEIVRLPTLRRAGRTPSHVRETCASWRREGSPRLPLPPVAFSNPSCPIPSRRKRVGSFDRAPRRPCMS